MSAAAPNPKNLLLLAGLGIGAYWLMTRRALASPSQFSTPAQIPSLVGNPYVGGIANALGNLFRPSAAVGTYDGRSAMPWNTATDTGAANNPSAYLATSQVDGVAYNPPANSPFDAAYISMVGNPSAEVDPGWTFFQ